MFDFKHNYIYSHVYNVWLLLYVSKLNSYDIIPL